MSGRFYELFVADAVKGPVPDDIKEKYGLTKFGDEISATTVSDARGIGWPLLYSAVSLTKQGKNYRDEWGGAADKGTAAHVVAETIGTYGLDAIDVNDFPDEIQGFVKALIGWWSRWKPEVIDQEFVTWSRLHGYAGRADLYCTLPKPMSTLRQTALIDWKTVGDSKKFERYPTAYLNNRCELIARAYAMKEHGHAVERCVLVRLAPDGLHHHYEIPQDTWQEHFDSFLRMKAEYDFRQKHDAGSLS